MFKSRILRISSEIEKLHLKVCKRILGVHAKGTNIAVYEELGKTLLFTQIAKLVVKYWLRIKSPLFSNTLVGKSAKASMELKLKPTIFRKYTLHYVRMKSLCHRMKCPTCRPNRLNYKKLFAIT